MNDVFYSDSNIPPPDYQTLEDQRLDTEQRVHRVNSDLFLSTEEKYREIVNKHEINIEYAKRLNLLQGYKIVFIFDDSGSMNTPLSESPLNKQNTLLKATRWDELLFFTTISLQK